MTAALKFNEDAQYIFRHHIFNQAQSTTDLHQLDLAEANLHFEALQGLKLTHFNDLYDTLIYSKLIEKALTLSPQSELIIDCGAGSSIPSLLALQSTHREDLQLLAIDTDPKAQSVGLENAAHLGLSSQYSFKSGDFMELLAPELLEDKKLLITSNPPYIAAPAQLSDHHFIPINGGSDGAKFILHLLNQDYPSGTTLALLWGSLTRPHQIIELIHKKYCPLHVMTYKTHFGTYTQNPVLKTYLYQLKERGEVYFEVNDKSEESQYVIGSILMAR